jgi:hypothetical protein
MANEIQKPAPPDWGPFRIWRIGDPAPWWRILERLEINQLKELAAMQIELQIEAAKLEIRQLEAMQKFVAR